MQWWILWLNKSAPPSYFSWEENLNQFTLLKVIKNHLKQNPSVRSKILKLLLLFIDNKPSEQQHDCLVNSFINSQRAQMPPQKHMRTDCEAKIFVYPILPCSCHTELDAPVPVFQRAVCVHKLGNINDGANKKWSQHSAPSSSSGKDTKMLWSCLPWYWALSHLFVCSLSTGEVLLLPSRVLLARMAPAACWAEQGWAAQGVGEQWGKTAKNHNLPQQRAERGFCLCTQGKYGFHVS